MSEKVVKQRSVRKNFTDYQLPRLTLQMAAKMVVYQLWRNDRKMSRRTRKVLVSAERVRDRWRTKIWG